jgi:hypothetical protein
MDIVMRSLHLLDFSNILSWTFRIPFTPTFIGIDLLFTHIHADQLPLIICTGLGFLIIEISVLRIYARIFLGNIKKFIIRLRFDHHKYPTGRSCL